MATCDNIFCSSRNRDGSCGALDLEGDRIEWCQPLKLYREYSHKIKVKPKKKDKEKIVRKIP